MFLSRNKKNNVYPCKPQFYCIKVGFKGVNIIQVCFRDGLFMSSAEYSCKLFKPFFCIKANSVDPDQTASRGTV